MKWSKKKITEKCSFWLFWKIWKLKENLEISDAAKKILEKKKQIQYKIQINVKYIHIKPMPPVRLFIKTHLLKKRWNESSKSNRSNNSSYKKSINKN